MKRTEFKAFLQRANKVRIVEDDLFNYAGWFWLNLTEKQLLTMVELMIAQGAEVVNGQIKLQKSGMYVNYEDVLNGHRQQHG